jgi:hypothetical protein
MARHSQASAVPCRGLFRLLTFPAVETAGYFHTPFGLNISDRSIFAIKKTEIAEKQFPTHLIMSVYFNNPSTTA